MTSGEMPLGPHGREKKNCSYPIDINILSIWGLKYLLILHLESHLPSIENFKLFKRSITYGL